MKHSVLSCSSRDAIRGNEQLRNPKLQHAAPSLFQLLVIIHHPSFKTSSLIYRASSKGQRSAQWVWATIRPARIRHHHRRRLVTSQQPSHKLPLAGVPQRHNGRDRKSQSLPTSLSRLSHLIYHPQHIHLQQDLHPSWIKINDVNGNRTNRVDQTIPSSGRHCRLYIRADGRRRTMAVVGRGWEVEAMIRFKGLGETGVCWRSHGLDPLLKIGGWEIM